MVRTLASELGLPPLPVDAMGVPGEFLPPVQPRQASFMQPLGLGQPQQQMQAMPIAGGRIPPSDIAGQNLGLEIIKKVVENKETQSQRGSFVQDILSKRFEPTQDDIVQANLQNTQAALLPESYKTTTPYGVATDRLGLELAPYTTLAKISGADAPATVQEWQYFNQLSPQDQERFLNMKRNPTFVNLGDRVMGTRSGEMIPKGVPPQDAPVLKGQQKKAQVIAEGEGQAQLDLPRVVDNTTKAIKNVTELRNHEGLNALYGWQGQLPIMPESSGADAEARLDQILGENFLAAYETLKGGGQITEVEGAKGENAIARLKNRKQSKESAQQAMDELIDILRIGLTRARNKAGGSNVAPSSPDMTVAPQSQGNVIDFNDLPD